MEARREGREGKAEAPNETSCDPGEGAQDNVGGRYPREGGGEGEEEADIERLCNNFPVNHSILFVVLGSAIQDCFPKLLRLVSTYYNNHCFLLVCILFPHLPQSPLGLVQITLLHHTLTCFRDMNS